LKAFALTSSYLEATPARWENDLIAGSVPQSPPGDSGRTAKQINLHRSPLRRAEESAHPDEALTDRFFLA
jgi:hypothetical protein